MTDIEQIPKPNTIEFDLGEIKSVNFKPHPYCITPAHMQGADWVIDDNSITEAEKHGAKCGIYFNPDNSKEYTNHRTKKCSKRCDLPHSEHTCSKVLFLRMFVRKEDLNVEYLNQYLNSIKDKLTELKIDGVSLVNHVKVK